MATPILDGEIIKLRRRLGDLYDESGNLIVNDTTPAGGEIYLGNAALVSTWRADELLDCYNDAIRMYLDYVTTILDKQIWHQYIPGYIRFEVKTSTSVSFNSIPYDYIALGNLSPKLYKFLDIRDPAATDKSMGLGVFVSPAKFFMTHSESLSTRSNQLTCCLFELSTEANSPHLVIQNKAGTNFHLLYVKAHTDLVHDSATDLSGITSEGLKRVLLMAEEIAQRYRSQEERTVAKSEMKTLMEIDASKKDGDK